jgi:hypothetical protein
VGRRAAFPGADRGLGEWTRGPGPLCATPGAVRADWPHGDANQLEASERSTVDAVLDFYGKMSAHQLSEPTHREQPWQEARRGLPDGSRSQVAISDASMAEFYDDLTAARAE